VSASGLPERLALAWRDALIIEAARVAGARRILSEDFQHGIEVEGVRIEDPFRHASGAGRRTHRS
jgi:predicted nucleic acid-binding protein